MPGPHQPSASVESGFPPTVTLLQATGIIVAALKNRTETGGDEVGIAIFLVSVCVVAGCCCSVCMREAVNPFTEVEVFAAVWIADAE
ncbi:MAG: hypothetical protein M1296_01490 [Chloroflexi bacterium]|nr:hypothetical protein [Chloroflexota bacterium]